MFQLRADCVKMAISRFRLLRFFAFFCVFCVVVTLFVLRSQIQLEIVEKSEKTEGKIVYPNSAKKRNSYKKTKNENIFSCVKNVAVLPHSLTQLGAPYDLRHRVCSLFLVVLRRGVISASLWMRFTELPSQREHS